MKKLTSLTALGLMLSSALMAQNFSVSGGTRYSLALCAGGNIISWGSNEAGQLARKTSTFATVTGSDGSVTVAADWKPSIVYMKDAAKNPITFTAVDAGSGAHAIAISCDSTVWTWGNNEHGQLGNGFASYGVYKTQCSDLTSIDFDGSQASICNKGIPQHVVAGETASAGNEYSESLKHVVSVTASKSASFAIVKDPKTGKTNLLAWGANKAYAASEIAIGQLGNGSGFDGSAYPRYVLDKNKNKLENIIAVDAGDNNAFAIVDDDNDGDPTTGTVYGWGNNSQNNITPTSTSNVIYATPISIDAAGTIPLTGVKKISAGEAFLLAYDKFDYAWTVGSEWSASGVASPRANGKSAFLNPKEAAKVIAGNASTYNGGEPYLTNIKGIATGQSSAMAITELTINEKKSNYIVAWGSAYSSEDKPIEGNCVNDLASNDALGSLIPRMAYRTDWRTGAVKLMDSVVSISDGDGVMYALRLEKKANGEEVRQLYVTGSNGAGQLGFDNTTNKGVCVFTKLDLPNCDLQAPCAIANLNPLTIKAGSSVTAYAGSDGVSTYHYVWQRYDENGDYTADGLPGWYEIYSCAASNTTNIDNTLWTFDGIGSGNSRLRCDGDNAHRTIDMNGKYKVTIYDTRPKTGCGTCPVVWDTTTVKYESAPIDTTAGAWCGTATTNYQVKVTKENYLNNPAAEKRLFVYGSATSSNVLASIANSDFVSNTVNLPSLNTADLESLSNDYVRMWVADSTRITDTLFTTTKSPILGSPFSTIDVDNNSNIAQNYQLFTAYSNFLFKSVQMNFQTYLGTGTVSVTPLIYKAVKTAIGYSLGELVSANDAQLLNITSTSTPYTVNVNTTIQGNPNGKLIYVIGFKISNNSTYASAPMVTLSIPQSNATGDVISVFFAGSLNNNELRSSDAPQKTVIPYNWVIQKTSDFGRIPIRFAKNCSPSISRITFKSEELTVLSAKSINMNTYLDLLNVANVGYKVENESIASITAKGIVTGKSAGKTKVIVYNMDSIKVADTITLTVLDNAVHFTAREYTFEQSTSLDLTSITQKESVVSVEYSLASPSANVTVTGNYLNCTASDTVKVYLINKEDATKKDSALFYIRLNTLANATIWDYNRIEVKFAENMALYSNIEKDFIIETASGSKTSAAKVTKTDNSLILELSNPLTQIGNITVAYTQALTTGSRIIRIAAKSQMLLFTQKSFVVYEADSINIERYTQQPTNIKALYKLSDNSLAFLNEKGLFIAKKAGIDKVYAINNLYEKQIDSAQISILPVFHIIGIQIRGNGSQLEVFVDGDYPLYEGIEKDFLLSVQEKTKAGSSYTITRVMKSADKPNVLLLQLDKPITAANEISLSYAPISALDGTSKVRSTFSVSTTTNDNETTEDAVEIYPNPAQASVRVQANNLQTLVLYNAQGSLMCRYETHTDAIEISVEHLPAGMYVAELITTSKTIKKTIIKQ